MPQESGRGRARIRRGLGQSLRQREPKSEREVRRRSEEGD